MAFFRRTRGRRHDSRKRARNANSGETRTHGSGILPQESDDQQRGGFTMPQLPHEHDESTGGEVPREPEPKLAQAQRDVENGIVDTDRRSAYGLSEGPPADPHSGKRTDRTEPVVRYVKKKIPFESR